MNSPKFSWRDPLDYEAYRAEFVRRKNLPAFARVHENAERTRAARHALGERACVRALLRDVLPYLATIPALNPRVQSVERRAFHHMHRLDQAFRITNGALTLTTLEWQAWTHERACLQAGLVLDAAKAPAYVAGMMGVPTDHVSHWLDRVSLVCEFAELAGLTYRVPEYKAALPALTLVKGKSKGKQKREKTGIKKHRAA